MAGLWQLLAETDARPRSNPELIWPALALVGLLLLGTGVIVWVKRWRAEPGPLRESPEEEMSRYRGQLARGEISPEEFEKITAAIRGRAPPAPPAQDRPPEPPASPPPAP
jgi:hypothetical protein